MMAPVLALGQNFEVNEKTVSGIFEQDSITKTELFYKINKWIDINYNSAQDVIQLSNEESGNIILKGISKIKYSNPSKIVYPNFKSTPSFIDLQFNHQLEINIKDNKYRLIFTVGKVDPDPYDLFNPCINLEGTDNEKILYYNNTIEKIYKSLLMGKKRREKFYELTEPMFEEINSKLVNYAKLLMLSLNDYITKSSENEDW